MQPNDEKASSESDGNVHLEMAGTQDKMQFAVELLTRSNDCTAATFIKQELHLEDMNLRTEQELEWLSPFMLATDEEFTHESNSLGRD